jgi:type IV pilus assembly protein PilB
MIRVRPPAPARPADPDGTEQGSGDFEVLADDGEAGDVAGSEDQGGDQTVVRLVNALMRRAIAQGASDIHIEPYEKEFRVRVRVDGVLQAAPAPPLRLRDAVTSRIKIMARLDIAEKRLPQDGRIKVRFTDDGRAREVDFRVSCLPTLFGEKLVLRLLDPEAMRLDLGCLGFEAQALERFRRAIRRPWGLVLVTGPTGSGKTSTLYSALGEISRPGVNVVTVEDPVEFNLPGINQVQVRDVIGLSFAAALRAFLRQDPDVILVGEIRDAETASIAVKAALTGHLVLSTLHTNDAASTVNRLVNMGVEPYLAAGSLNLLCAQRLVRRVCDHCEVRGRGCERCTGTGYRGRVGLFEVMELSEPLRELVRSNAAIPDIQRLAASEGMESLRASGLHKVQQGVTTIDEVLRETV